MINFFQQYGTTLGLLLTLAIILSVATAVMTFIFLREEIRQAKGKRRCERCLSYRERECPEWADPKKWEESFKTFKF